MVPRRTTADYTRTAWRLFASPDHVTVWDWQCTHGRIPPSESAKPGPWLPEFGMLMRKPLAVVSARLTQKALPGDPFAILATMVVVCGPSQGGKTKSFLHPIVSYAVDVLRTNIAFITHKQKQIRQHLKVRMLPMFEATPQLARYLPATEHLRRDRLTGNLWQLDGANLHAICGNVASDLREYSHQIGVADEIEAYVDDVDGEGNPIDLFLDRQKRYEESSLFAAGSTPNDVSGHTWSQLNQGSHERILVRCPACGHDQDLTPDRLRVTRAGATTDEILREDLALWHCAYCDQGYASDAVDDMVERAILRDRDVPGTWEQTEDHPLGIWRPATIWTTNPDGTQAVRDIGTWTAAPGCDKHQLVAFEPPTHSKRSFHRTYLHSRDCSNGRFLAHEMAALAGTAEQWHTHVTGWRAEPYIAAGSVLSTAEIDEAVGTAYIWKTCPDPVDWVIVSADEQGNDVAKVWFAYEVVGVKRGGETYLLEAGRVTGFAGLEALEQRDYICGGQVRKPDLVGVDGSNGMLHRLLRAWAAASYTRNLEQGMPPKEALAKVTRILLEGAAHLKPDEPWRERPRTSKRDQAHIPIGCRIFQWNKTYWKDFGHARLKGEPGYAPFHVPTDDEERPKDLKIYLKSMTSEERVLREIGAPGGRKRVAIVWQERITEDHNGRKRQRHDTHWWDAHNQRDVMIDLRRGFDTPVPGATPPRPRPSAPKPAPEPPPAPHSRPRHPGQNRRHSRLRR